MEAGYEKKEQPIATKRAENPIESRGEDSTWPPGGRFFPLGSGTKAAGDWEGFFEMLMMLKAGMLAMPLALEEGTKVSASEAVKGMRKNFYTTVLATVQCGGWSLIWASAVASMIAQCYRTCSLLILFAIAGGPACDEELAFLHVILLELGFTASLVAKKCALETRWEWTIDRPGAATFVVQLKKYHSLDAFASGQIFSPKEANNQAPNLKRVAVISCAEKWPPQESETLYLQKTKSVTEIEPGTFRYDNEKDSTFRTAMNSDARDPKRRSAAPGSIWKGTMADGWLKIEFEQKEAMTLNMTGKTVNDVLNEKIIKYMAAAEERAEKKGFAPPGNSKDSEEANAAYNQYHDLKPVSLKDKGPVSP